MPRETVGLWDLTYSRDDPSKSEVKGDLVEGPETLSRYSSQRQKLNSKSDNTE